MAHLITYIQNSGFQVSFLLDAPWITWKLCNEPKINSPRVCLCMQYFWGAGYGISLRRSCNKEGPNTTTTIVELVLRRPSFFIFARPLLVSPVSRKSARKNVGFEKVKLERNADKFGCEFWAWVFLVGLGPWKNKAKKFGQKNCHQDSPAIFLKFAKPPKTFTANPLCRTSGSTSSIFFEASGAKRTLQIEASWFISTWW